ncbi:alpha/beta fold hydrolase [Amnibacterium endophyticum]|uniref:Alpha/beta fold hydrolase n=1 Tax=Amnibacterium endophyticum TaxID=2109337 RepID=A0ABW4L9W6_9MICO
MAIDVEQDPSGPSEWSSAPRIWRSGPDQLRPADVFLWRAARGPRRGSAPLVYVPGLGPHSTNRTRWERFVQRVEMIPLRLDREVWIVGRLTALGAGTTMASLAADHARAIRSRFDGPVDVLGESTGGSIALQLALDHPEVVKRLFLVSAAVAMRGSGRAAQREVGRSLRAGAPRRAAGIMLAHTTRRPLQRRLLTAAGFLLGRVVIGANDHDLIAEIEAEDRLDLRSRIDQLSVPTVLIGGSDDGYYSPELFAETTEHVDGAEYVALPDKGHMTVTTDRTVAREIRERLREE